MVEHSGVQAGNRRPTLSDVARHASVSPSTVSRVINHSAPVRAEVQARVLASLHTLGYEPPLTRPNAPALQGAVVLIIPDLLNPFFADVARGVQDEAAADDAMVVLIDTTEDPQREERLLRALVRQSVGGIIAGGTRLQSEQFVAIRDRHRVPMVLLNRSIRHPEIPCVIADSGGASYHATRHLLSLNHTRIAFIAGPSAAEPTAVRRHGIETALAEAGLALPPEWSVSSLPNVNGGFLAMSSLMALQPDRRPTAVIVYNDIMALGALHAARAQRLRVPDDVSVIGFDDIAMAAHANPPLTTIAQPKYRMGRVAMQLLRSLMQGNASPGEGYTLMESPLIVRESTGPAPPDGGGVPAVG